MEVHFEPFLQCSDLGAEEAMIAWGGFYFRRGASSFAWFWPPLHAARRPSLTVTAALTGQPRSCRGG